MLKPFAKLNYTLFIVVLASFAVSAQAPAKKITKDEIYHALASQVITQSDSPLTNIKGALDEVIEIGEIAVSSKDGKATVTIKEKAETNSMSTNKAIPLIFAPQPDGSWKWEQFKNDAKFYPVEKLYPYSKDELKRRREAAEMAWKRFLGAMTAEGEAAFKLLDTAKVVIKKDPEPLATVNAARAAIKKALESNDAETIKAAYKELNQAVEPMAKLVDDNPDLKANDAYLRLNEAFETAKKNLVAARTEYLTGVNIFNDKIQRLPFTLVAFGFGFTKLEPQIEVEQQ